MRGKELQSLVNGEKPAILACNEKLACELHCGLIYILCDLLKSLGFHEM